MAVDVFPAASTGSLFYKFTANQTNIVSNLFTSGKLYRLRAWNQTGSGTPSVSLNYLDVNYNVSSTSNFVDVDTGSSTNYAELIVSFATTPRVSLLATSDIYLETEILNYREFVSPVSSYTTTGSVVLDGSVSAVLIGGGGGGAGGWGNNGAGGGGGSGYMQKFDLSAGTYSLVIGAGGAGGAIGGNAGSAGGASSINGVTANGGNGGLNYANGGGGAGGSGGGGGGYTYGGGGSGGFNGNAGTSTANVPGKGGAGSGVTSPGWAPPSVSAGGYYGGGSGGSYSNSYPSPPATPANGATGTGAGGTGGSSRDGGNGSAPGAAGGNGVLYVLKV